MDNKIIPFEDLPALIGPIKKNNKINFKELGFSELDELNIEHFEEFYLDYDGFYGLLEKNNFQFNEFIEEIQHNQISLLAEYFFEKKEFNKAIKLLTRKYDWLIDIYTYEEDYEECAKTLKLKNMFLDELKMFNEKYKSNYGSE